MCMLFAATYPRARPRRWCSGARWRARPEPRTTPGRRRRRRSIEASEELIAPLWGQGATIEIFSPSLADDPRAREFQARFERQAASPMRVAAALRDVPRHGRPRGAAADPGADPGHAAARRPRGQLPGRPLARRADRGQPLRRAGGRGPLPLGGRQRRGAGRRSRSSSPACGRGRRPNACSRRSSSPTSSTRPALAAELGDRRWRELLEEHQEVVRERLERFEGREIKTHRGRLPRHLRRPDPGGRVRRGRSPPTCPRSGSRSGPACTPARSS